MKKLLALLLSAALLATNFVSAVAGINPTILRALAPRRAVTVAVGDVTRQTTKEIANLAKGLGYSATFNAQAALNNTVSLADAQKILLSNKTIASDVILLAQKTLPAVIVEGTAVPSYAQMLTALDSYRSALTASNVEKLNNIDRASDVMATLSNIGLFGESQDAALILETAQKDFGAYNYYIDNFATRALLNVGGYEELQKLADIRLASGKKLNPVWQGVKSQVEQAGQTLTIEADRIATQAFPASGTLSEAVVEAHPYAYILLDPSEKATVAWKKLRAIGQEKFTQASAQVEVEEALQAKEAKAQVTPEIKAPQPQFTRMAMPEGIRSVTLEKPVATSSIQDKVHQYYQNKAVKTNAQEAVASANDKHAFRDQGLASEGLEATFPVYWEDKATGKTTDVTFQFEDQTAKEAFYKRVDLEADEFFVFDKGSGSIIIRKELTAEQKANGAKAKERGFSKIFFEGGQKAPAAYYKGIFAREMASVFATATQEEEVLALLKKYKDDLKLVLSADLLAKYPTLAKYLSAKASVLDSIQFPQGEVIPMSKAIAADLEGQFATQAAPIKVFKDDVGYWAQNFAGFAEGTFGTMGQANTSALGLLNISKGFLSNLPTGMGQFGPAWAPFIGAWSDKYGAKKLLNIGQIMGTAGHLGAAASLGAGALGVLPPLAAFGGMVTGITVNGVAGSIMKQVNPMVAKTRAGDRVSSSATIADLNSWASIGGMYCYLFLPIVGGLTWLLSGGQAGLGALATMFGVAATIPLTANVLLRKSRIQNAKKPEVAKKNVFKTLGSNLKFGFKSPTINKMFWATAGGHFMGLGFNSGPGNFIKENIANSSLAMLTSFVSIYLTVFAGRKLGAIAMKNGVISDKALAGLSALVGVTMGAASLLPGLGFAARCALFAAAGLGFSNWVNVLQAIELARPENAGKEAAVSSVYILARTSGMLTMAMGAFGDQLGAMMSLSPSTAALYALTMPLAAGVISMGINWKYITKDLWPTVKRWLTPSSKKTLQVPPAK